MYTENQIQDLLAGLSRTMAALWGEAIENAGLEISALADDAPDEDVAQKIVVAFEVAVEQTLELTRMFSALPELENDSLWQPAIQKTVESFEDLLSGLQDDEATSYDRLQLVVDIIGGLGEVPIPQVGSTLGETKIGKLFGYTGYALTTFNIIEAMRTGNYSRVASGITMIGTGILIEGAIAAGLVAVGLLSWPFLLAGAAVSWVVAEFYEDKFDELYQSIFGNEEAGFVVERYARLYGGPYLNFDSVNAVAQLGTAGDDVSIGFQGKTNIVGGGGGNDWLTGAEETDVLGGGSGNDRLDGLEGDDQLFGADGDDRLNGGLGNDTMEGGDGFDTYEFTSSDFSDATEDVIIDSDGTGKITFEGVAVGDLSVNTVSRDGLGWQSQDGTFRFQVIGEGDSRSLIITHRESGSRIIVKNWSNGDLSITLPDLGQPGTPENPFPQTNDDDLVGHDGDPEAAHSGNDFISGLGGNDGIDGGYGDDWIDGGHGNDLLLGGPGSNRMIGGLGDDILLGLPMVMDWVAPDNLQGWNNIVDGVAGLLNRGNGWYSYVQGGGATAGDATQNLSGFQVVARYEPDDDPATDDTPWVSTDPNTLPNGDDEIDAGEGSDVAYGGEGDDIISGGIGNDLLVGGSDNDYIEGEDGDDLILGDDLPSAGGIWAFVATQISSQANSSGNDVLIGGAGDDKIYGQGGNDVIDGGAGNDVLQGDRVDYGMQYSYTPSGVAGNDYIDGGDGDDQIFGDGGDDTLLGGAGSDYIVGDSIAIDGSQHGADTIDGGDGADILLGLGGDDVIRGGAGNDLLLGDASGSDVDPQYHGNDNLYGGAGDDELQGNGGDDYLDGGTGQDLLLGQDGNDMLYGGDDEDELQGGAGNDSLFGGKDNDRLFGEEGDDYLSGDDGEDELYGGTGDDRLSGGLGVDMLGGGEGNDVLDGGEGNDILDGEAGNDTIYGGAGDDTIDGDDGDDVVYAGTGNDSIYGGTGQDVIHGEDGNDVVTAAEGNDQVYGGAGDDTLNGDSGDDIVNGEDGNDYLAGGEGDDVLIGGAGNDILLGGAGNDRFHFEVGFGIDQILLEEANAGVDTISFGEGIAASDLVYSVHGADLQIQHVNGQDAIVVRGYFAPGASVSVQLADGTIFDRTSFEVLLGVPPAMAGTSGDDVLYGTEDDDNLHGGAGNDTIHGLSGDDHLFGGSGNDTFYGSLGNDVIDGGSGNDVYYFHYGNGIDTILNLGNADAGSDVIRFGPSLTRDMISSFQIAGDDLLIAFVDGANTDAIYLEGFLSEANGTHILQFDDGSWLTAQDFRSNGDSWSGTGSDDIYIGTNANNTADGLAGDDELLGMGGNDRLFGNDGNDRLYGGDGDDVLEGNDGEDVLEGGAGNDQLYGYDFASSDADTLRGGAGDDRYYLSGGYQYGQSPDIVVELEGEGIDTVYTRSYSYTLTPNVENLVGVYHDMWWYWQNPIYPGWRVDIPRQLIGNDLDNVIQFADPPWGGSHDQHYYLLDGGAGNDTLVGTQANETFVVDSLGDVVIETDTGPDASVDTIRASLSYSLAQYANIENLELTGTENISGWGNSGNNTLNGRMSDGINHLYGGLGDDRYIITAQDVVIELAGEGNDTVVIDHTDASYTTGQWFDISNYANVENLELGNNLTVGWDFHGGINQGAFRANLRGDAGDNVLTGNGFRNELRGGDGNDTLIGGERELNTSEKAGRDSLYGEAGDDILHSGSGGADLYGGIGSDSLYGGSASDDFHYAIGDGRDTIVSYKGNDFNRVIFAEGIDPDDVTFSREGLDLIVQVGSNPPTSWWSPATGARTAASCS